MSKINYILVFLFATLITFQLKANDYVWLHGLNDNFKCWKIYNEALTPGIGIQSNYTCGYSDGTSYSISQIASNVWYNANSYEYNGTSWQSYKAGDSNYILGNKHDMILIGHSLGGLAAREIQYQYGGLKDEFGKPRIKGIITIGTPHQGAYVENAIALGKQHEFISSLCNKFAIGLAGSTTALVGPFWPAQAGVVILADGAIFVVTNVLLVPYIEEQMANGSQQCEKDMQEGSTYMNTISSRKVNVPILCFAAEEDRWQLARLTHCAINKDDLQTNASLNTDGNYDKTGYDFMQGAQIGCYSIAGIHAGCAAGALALGWYNPYCWYAAGINVAAGAYWTSVGVYLNDGFDYDYSVLLGSYAYEKRSYSYQRMVCPEPNLPYELVKGKHNIVAPPTYSEDDCYSETVYETRTVAVPCSHDGTVSTYSQLLDKSKGSNVIWAGSTIKGVNHMEEFNHYKTRKEFDDVLNGRTYSPLTFQK